MYKNIVVGTDGSKTAEIAVRHATMLAKSSDATLHIVHAFQPVSVHVAALSASSGGPVIDLEPLNVAINDSARMVCVLGNALAQKVFPRGSALNEVVKYNGINYNVVGVLAAKGVRV